MKMTYRIQFTNSYGDIVDSCTLDELVSTGHNYTINLMNYGLVGSGDFELLVQNEDHIRPLIKQRKTEHDGDVE
jgi:hypothetical protein